MTARWQRLTIPVADRPLEDANGQLVQRASAAPGAVIVHWADPGLARAWFQRAAQLVRDESRIRALDVPIDRANVEAQNAQFAYVRAIVDALANGYNALNVLWFNDPRARQLYREWLAGPPGEVAGNTAEFEYGDRRDYNADWYTANQPMPVGRHFRGLLPRDARAGFLASYPRPVDAPFHSNQIRLRSGLFVDFANGEPRVGRTVDTVMNVQNRAFVLFGGRSYCGLPAQSGDLTALWSESSQEEYFGGDPVRNLMVQCLEYPPDQACRIEGQSCDPRGPIQWDDWRTLWFDEAASVFGIEFDTGVPLALSPPLRSYLPWLRAWTERVTARRPEDTILDARAFVVYQNLRWANSFGGIDTFLSRVLSRDSTIYAQIHTAPPELAVIGASAAALAPAIGSLAGPVGAGVGAVIGGAAALTTAIATGLLRGNIKGVGRDDLGRYKPSFERGWLSGNPGMTAQEGGAPSIDVPNLPGEGQDATNVPQFPTDWTGTGPGPRPPAPPPVGGTPPPPDSVTAEGSFLRRVALPLAVGGGLAYAGAKLLKR